MLLSVVRETYEYQRQIWAAPVDGSEPPRRLTSGARDSRPAWSPDGRWLAFVRDPGPAAKARDEGERDKGVGRPQVWLLPLAGGEPVQLTTAAQGAGDPVWAPDSRSLLVTMDVGEADDIEAERSEMKDRQIPAVRTLDTLLHRVDSVGWIYERRTHLFRVPVDGGPVQELTSGDWDDGQAAWSPDGTRVAFCSDRSDQRWIYPATAVWVLDLASGDLRVLTDESFDCGHPAWSPDGATLAFTAGQRRGKSGHEDIFTVPSDGSGAARCLTEAESTTWANAVLDDQRSHPAGRLFWSSDGTEILALGSGRGEAQVWALAAEGGKPRPLTEGHHNVYAFSTDSSRRVTALAISDPVTPGDLYVGFGGAPRRLTELNAELLSQVELAQPVEIGVTSDAGARLQGWVMRPAGAEGDLPAVLEIHGGPRSMYGWSFFMEFQVLCASGFAVVYGNPRGSLGYGREFSAAVATDWGGGDYRDLTAILDEAIACGGLDADRLGVAGGSYGGYMTLWMISHTDRFKAAVSMRCLSNFASFFGTSDLGWWLVDEDVEARPWEDLPKLMEHSPITYVDRIHTPLLLMHSDQDLRCPISEAEQVFSALKYLGREVRLMRFEGQSHELSRSGHPRSRVIRLNAIAGWFVDHVPVGG